jgi:ferrous iron transport protein B
MASRTIEEERDRRMTITVTSFIPCGAKLPVIALLGGALFNQALWVAPSIYFLGIGAVIVSGIMLKKTPLFSGPPVPFVMELPSYRWPTLEFVLRSMWERGSSFIRKAGTVILLSSIVIWFLSSFGVSEGSFAMVEDTAQSLLAVLGNGIAWVFTPLGWGDWKAAVATITGLVAKENVVGTFGVLFGAGEVTEAGAEIWSQIAAYFTPFSGYSFLIFNMICAPCFAAIGAIRREMNSGKWTAFAVGYQTVFAYALALIYYQIALWLKGKVFSIWTGIALVVLGAMLYQLLRPAPKQKMNALAGYAQEIGNA